MAVLKRITRIFIITFFIISSGGAVLAQAPMDPPVFNTEQGNLDLHIVNDLLWTQYSYDVRDGDITYYKFATGVVVARTVPGMESVKLSVIKVYDSLVKIFARDRYLYLVTYSCRLLVYDMIDPADPVLAAKLELSASYRDLARIGDQLYLTTIAGKLYNIRVFPPTALAVEAFNDDGGLNLFKSDDCLVVIGSSLLIFDIRDPAKLPDPYTYFDANLDSYDSYTVFYGGYAYTSVPENDRILIHDISDPSAPRMIKILDEMEYMHRMKVIGHFLHTYTGVYDLSDPLNPRPVSISTEVIDPEPEPWPDFSFAGQEVSSGNVRWIYSSDTYCAVIPGGARLLLLDASDPANPVLKSTLYFPGGNYMALPDGNDLYSDNRDTLAVYDVSDLANPRLRSETYIPGGGDLQLFPYNKSGNTLFAVKGNYRIFCIDVSDPDTPVITGSFSIDKHYDSIEIIGNKLIAAGYVWGITIADITDKTNPEIKKEIPLEEREYIIGMGQKQGIIYIFKEPMGERKRVLEWYKITDSFELNLLGQEEHSYQGMHSHYAYKMNVLDKYIFLNMEGAAYVYGICEPATPVFEGILTGVSSIAEYTSIGDYIYAANYSSLRIFGTEEAPEEQVRVLSPAGSPRLHQNFPNPFNPMTTIRFELVSASPVTLTIYNALGQTVKTLAYGELPAGVHELRWDGTNRAGIQVAAGMYIYRLKAAGVVKTKKMLLLR